MSHVVDVLAVIATVYATVMVVGIAALGALHLRDLLRPAVADPDVAELQRRQLLQERAAADALGYPPSNTAPPHRGA